MALTTTTTTIDKLTVISTTTGTTDIAPNTPTDITITINHNLNTIQVISFMLNNYLSSTGALGVYYSGYEMTSTTSNTLVIKFKNVVALDTSPSPPPTYTITVAFQVIIYKPHSIIMELGNV